MKPALTLIGLTALFYTYFLLRMHWWTRRHRADRAHAQDPTYFAVLAATAFVFSSIITETVFSGWTTNWPRIACGVCLIVVSGLWARWAFKMLGANYTPAAENPDPNQMLVTTGPYRLTRHPIYLGSVGTMSGYALLLGAKWAWLAMLVLLAALAWRIVREERFLRGKFGRPARVSTEMPQTPRGG